MDSKMYLQRSVLTIIISCMAAFFFIQTVSAVTINHPYDRWAERGRLISYKYLKTLSKKRVIKETMEMRWAQTYIDMGMDLSDRYDFFTKKELKRAINYHIDVYSLIYETVDPHGNPTAASGAVLVPRKHSKNGSLLSLQRGTIFPDEPDAPSYGSTENWGIWRALIPASNGFFTIMPDFLGYGASKHMVHPYTIWKPTGTAVADMALAARKFAEKIGWTLDNKLFLMGLSEGGYATMAAQREIEANYSDFLQVTASAPAGGPYVFTKMLEDALQGEYAFLGAIISHLLMSYNDTYRLDRPMTDFFNPPYDELLWELHDKSHTEAYVNSQMPLYTVELFSSTFLSDYNGSGEVELKAAMVENDIHWGWTPVAPVRIYSGTEETICPWELSEMLYDGLNQPGTNVQLIGVEGADHLQSIIPITLLTLDWFNTF